MNAQIDHDRTARIERIRNAIRGVSALAYSERHPDEALIGRRGDLSDLLDILGDELEAATEGAVFFCENNKGNQPQTG